MPRSSGRGSRGDPRTPRTSVAMAKSPGTMAHAKMALGERPSPRASPKARRGPSTAPRLSIMPVKPVRDASTRGVDCARQRGRRAGRSADPCRSGPSCGRRPPARGAATSERSGRTKVASPYAATTNGLRAGARSTELAGPDLHESARSPRRSLRPSPAREPLRRARRGTPAGAGRSCRSRRR